jgi:hypothetical protein
MNFTRWVIAGIVVVVLLIDLVLAVTMGIDATISVQLTAWSHIYPAIPFALGFLMGHFFAQNERPPSAGSGLVGLR